MLDFGVMKCDLFCTHEAFFSIKILHEMGAMDVSLVNRDSIVQMRVKISSEAFNRSKHIGGLYILKEIRSLPKEHDINLVKNVNVDET